jgi:hypothetical protein
VIAGVFHTFTGANGCTVDLPIYAISMKDLLQLEAQKKTTQGGSLMPLMGKWRSREIE